MRTRHTDTIAQTMEMTDFNSLHSLSASYSLYWPCSYLNRLLVLSEKLFLYSASGLIPVYLLPLYKAQTRPVPEYLFHILDDVSFIPLSPPHLVQRKTIRLITDFPLTSNMQSSAHCSFSNAVALAFVPCFVSPSTFDLRKPFLDFYHLLLSFHLKVSHSSLLVFSRASKLWNISPLSVFPPSYNLSLFKSRVNILVLTWVFLITLFYSVIYL